jgi:hypothetical protein
MTWIAPGSHTNQRSNMDWSGYAVVTCLPQAFTEQEKVKFR